VAFPPTFLVHAGEARQDELQQVAAKIAQRQRLAMAWVKG